ncbi:MAG: helix-turn-helix domain-containing protein [Clostridium sp.]|nr:helix-turn-helix domain-containing protein [Clostridium sp.]
MNKDTAKRLLDYRKANGYSQEELAEKIGVSRQAISKWERGESSPDTDNLIALARLYSITIDELINGKTEINSSNNESTAANEEQTESTSKNPEVSFKNGIHIHNGKDNVDIDFSGIHIESNNGESVHIGKGYGVKVNGIDEQYVGKRGFSLAGTITPIALIIAFLVIGFSFDWGWRLGWLLLLLIPIIESLISSVKHRDPNRFAYPILAAEVFLAYGMINHIWHPTWIVFLTIPLYYIIVDFFKPKSNKKSDD